MSPTAAIRGSVAGSVVVGGSVVARAVVGGEVVGGEVVAGAVVAGAVVAGAVVAAAVVDGGAPGAPGPAASSTSAGGCGPLLEEMSTGCAEVERNTSVNRPFAGSSDVTSHCIHPPDTPPADGIAAPVGRGRFFHVTFCSLHELEALATVGRAGDGSST